MDTIDVNTIKFTTLNNDYVVQDNNVNASDSIDYYSVNEFFINHIFNEKTELEKYINGTHKSKRLKNNIEGLKYIDRISEINAYINTPDDDLLLNKKELYNMLNTSSELKFGLVSKSFNLIKKDDFINNTLMYNGTSHNVRNDKITGVHVFSILQENRDILNNLCFEYSTKIIDNIPYHPFINAIAKNKYIINYQKISNNYFRFYAEIINDKPLSLKQHVQLYKTITLLKDLGETQFINPYSYEEHDFNLFLINDK